MSFPRAVSASGSTGVESSGDGYRISGDLTIRGVAHPVVPKAELGGVVANLQGGRRGGFSASTKISRKEWGRALGSSPVGLAWVGTCLRRAMRGGRARQS